jgi:hypothetical protein
VRGILPAPGTAVVSRTSTQFDIEFRPSGIGDLYDTLDVYFTKPCVDSASIPIYGKALEAPRERSVQVSIHDTTVVVQDSLADIPVYAMVLNGTGDAVLDSAYIDIEYSPLMMRVLSADRGEVTETVDIANEKATARLMLPSINVSSVAPRRVATVRVAILLGPRDKDSLRITGAMGYASTAIAIRGTGAELRYEGICQEGGRRLIGQGQKMTLMVLPHPVTTRLDVTAHLIEKGTTSIIVHDLMGRELLHEEWAGSANQIVERSFDMSMYPEGVYALTLRGLSARLTHLFVIERHDK